MSEEELLRARCEDWIAKDRWANEGGRVPGEDDERRPQVLIAGGGVAGLEALLALRALLGRRVDVTIVSRRSGS